MAAPAGRGAVQTRVMGIDELKSGSYDLFDDIEKKSEAEFESVANQVAVLVRAKVPRRTGRLASSVDAAGTSHGAEVGYGPVPYAGAIDFGGWPPGRPYYPDGRYLWPTAQDYSDQLQRAGENAAQSEIRGRLWPRPTPF